jgi:phosphate transport system permease protein
MNKSTSAAGAPPRRDIKALVNAGLPAATPPSSAFSLVRADCGQPGTGLRGADVRQHHRKGYPAFWQTYIQVPITFDRRSSTPPVPAIRETWPDADYAALIRASLKQLFPQVEGRLPPAGAVWAGQFQRAASSCNGGCWRSRADRHHASEIWLLASAEVDTLVKGNINRSPRRIANGRSPTTRSPGSTSSLPTASSRSASTPSCSATAIRANRNRPASAAR